MADPIPLSSGRKPSKTPPEVAAQLRALVEEMINVGVMGGMVSGETLENGTWYGAAPASSAFVRGHVRDLFDYIEE